MPFHENLSWIQNGEDVDGTDDPNLPNGVSNRPLNELLENDEDIRKFIKYGDVIEDYLIIDADSGDLTDGDRIGFAFIDDNHDFILELSFADGLVVQRYHIKTYTNTSGNRSVAINDLGGFIKDDPDADNIRAHYRAISAYADTDHGLDLYGLYIDTLPTADIRVDYRIIQAVDSGLVRVVAQSITPVSGYYSSVRGVITHTGDVQVKNQMLGYAAPYLDGSFSLDYDRQLLKTSSSELSVKEYVTDSLGIATRSLNVGGYLNNFYRFVDDSYADVTISLTAAGNRSAEFKMNTTGNGDSWAYLNLREDTVLSQFNWNDLGYYTISNLDLGTSDNPWKDVYYSGSLNSTSDKRLKKELKTDKPGLDFIEKLTPRVYEKRSLQTVYRKLTKEELDIIEWEMEDLWFKDENGEFHRALDPKDNPELEYYIREVKPSDDTDGLHHLGLFAQDVQEALKELKLGELEEAIVDSSGEYLSLKYVSLIPVLIQAVKELSAKVKELEGGK